MYYAPIGVNSGLAVFICWIRVGYCLKQVWPSGLRRQTQDLLGVTPHEFKSRSLQIFYAPLLF